MSFAGDLQAFTQKVGRRSKAAFAGSAVAVQESVVDGSPITGAPGQPVDTGNLKASWQIEFTGEWTASVTTGVEYAQAIEAGIGPHGPMTLRSEVGGFHSVKLTRAGWPRLVESVAVNLP
jgi:hypothetical protein